MQPAPRKTADAPWIHVNIPAQRLTLRRGDDGIRSWPVATGVNGAGERNGSGRTPRGWHVIRACIGAGAPMGTVFVGRRPTGEVYTPELGRMAPERDWILTRILWLSGLEPGFNRLGERDTMRRYIYIHGGPDELPIGVPGSRGCVRMRNEDVVQLFECVTAGTRVLVEDRER